MSSQKTLEERVYNNYRDVIRAKSRFRTGDNARAGERKQTALEIASHRYNLPISQVKNIVREVENKNGTPRYNGSWHDGKTHYEEDEVVASMIMHARALFAANPVPCKCGSTDMVRVRLNPEQHLRGIDEVDISCFSCYRKRAGLYF